jgi:hypothetical protein
MSCCWSRCCSRRSNDARGVARFIMQGTRGSAKQPPFAVLMLRAIFDLAIRYAPGDQIAEKFLHRGAILRVGATPEFTPDQFLRAVSEHIQNLRAGKRISRVGIQRDHQVGEAVHQAAGELLFAVQAALHLALPGDVQERSLIPHKLAGWIVDGRGRVQCDDFVPVAPVPECDFARAKESNRSQFCTLFFPIRGVPVERGEVQLQKVFLALEPEHLRQRGVHFCNAVICRGQVYAFSQRLKQFREVGFVFAFPCDVACKSADPMHDFIANDRVQDAVEIIS